MEVKIHLWVIMIGALSDKGVRVPGGFATTSYGFRLFLNNNKIQFIDTSQISIEEITSIILAQTGLKRHD
ncbi:MAG: hypothetical protein HON68_11570 [Gammaproteobacteria bacterium]|nr:hypothetical protein [Gammaproteobacteria bacterium]MBT3489849.1 hypothetical protein [Gammaproteobacteria bacterium]MBT3718673.1 hypothetical protein [Gammaproteobacteria bacterium]MBT3844745.1 hypothetical protein [Gammaproteobacteria bacterium]MBT3893857.1 hypothetical protein [Gammaproteobacteria bacterium]